MKLVRFGSGTEGGKHGLLINHSIFLLLSMTTTSALESLKEGDERWTQESEHEDTERLACFRQSNYIGSGWRISPGSEAHKLNLMREWDPVAGTRSAMLAAFKAP